MSLLENLLCSSVLCVLGTSAIASPYCQAPEVTMVAFADNISGLDTYVASLAPGFDTGYVGKLPAFFGQGALLKLADAEPEFTSEEARNACKAVLEGRGGNKEQERVISAIRNSEIWFRLADVPVEHTWQDAVDVGEVGYISAHHIGFSNEQDWLEAYGPRLGTAIFGNHFARGRITEIIGANTENAHMLGEGMAHETVSYCNSVRENELMQSVVKGRFHREDIHHGILREEPDAFADCGGLDVIEIQANCSTRELGGLSIDYEDGTQFWGSGAGATLGNFFRLCPEASREIAREACARGNVDECSALNRAELSSTCAVEEETVFSCRIEGKKESVSICRRDGNIAYVFGASSEQNDLRITRSIRKPFQIDHGEPHRFENQGYLYEVYGDWADGKVNVYKGNQLLNLLRCAK